ncbi:amino acid adenylation domain-containing protein, partial [Acidobacteriota bacterium]
MRNGPDIDENLLLFTSKYIKQKEYWQNKLTGEIGETKILSPLETHQPTKLPGNIEKVEIIFPEKLGQRLIKLSKQSDLSLYIILTAGVNSLISRYAYKNNQDIIIISPVFKHRQSGNPLTNRLFIYQRLNREETFKELILKTRDSVLEAYENQDYPYDKLIEYIFNVPGAGEGEADRMLSDILCSLDNIHDQRNIAEIKDKFTFCFSRDKEEISGHILYDPGQYPQYYVSQIGSHLVQILAEAVEDINIRIGDLSMLTPAEKQRLLKDWNDTDREYSTEQLIQDLFQARAAELPDHTALVDEDRFLTYSEFNARTNRLARVLRRKGVQSDDIIGIMAEHSLELMIALMGILTSGAAYLPLDPFYPEDRLQYMLEDSRAPLVLVRDTYINKIKMNAAGETLILDSGEKFKQDEDNTNPVKVNLPNHLAYVIYTSGSTGRAKGVAVEHGNLITYLHAFDGVAHFTNDAVMIQLTSYSFDIFVEEFYAVLVKGGRVVIFEKSDMIDVNRLPGFMQKYAINIIDTSPLVLNELNRPDQVDAIHLDIMLSGGDALKGENVNNLVKTGRILNGYGPTEITVCTSFYECSGKEPASGNIPIGKPIANYNIYILDQGDHLLPIGVPGELCVSGPGVSRGYLNQPELTLERYCLRRPGGRFSRKAPGRGDLLGPPWTPRKSFLSPIYHTGDFARWLPEGNIEFLGRIDNQVQIRGFRVEPGEIEARLIQRKEIKDAVVITKEDSSGDKYLCAYYVPYNPVTRGAKVPGRTDTGVSSAQLREFLLNKLPYYMVPAYFVTVEKIPLTPTGKIDRKALPEPDLVGAADEYTAPRDETEKKLAEIWSEVLRLDKNMIGIDANFFELGGHSLKATSLTIKINKQLETKISMVDIFTTPTIRGLGEQIKGTLKEGYSPIKAVEKRDYYPLSSAQKRLYFLQHMAPGNTSYNISEAVYLEGEPEKKTLEEIFVKLIQRHESLRTLFPEVHHVPVQKINESFDFEIKYYDSNIAMVEV